MIRRFLCAIGLHSWSHFSLTRSGASKRCHRCGEIRQEFNP